MTPSFATQICIDKSPYICWQGLYTNVFNMCCLKRHRKDLLGEGGLYCSEVGIL